MSGFLVGLFQGADPVSLSGYGLGVTERMGLEVTGLDLLDRGARKVRNDLRDQPAVQATLLDTLGSVYMSYVRFDDAYPLFTDALAIRREHFDEPHADIAKSLLNLSQFHFLEGRYRRAERRAVAQSPHAGTSKAPLPVALLVPLLGFATLAVDGTLERRLRSGVADGVGRIRHGL